MQQLHKRANYDKVGQPMNLEDLCVGVFDGTNFNSGTCRKENLESSDPDIPVDEMIIRNNTVSVNAMYFNAIRNYIASDSQAQCVMTSDSSAACWTWDNALRTCYMRYRFANARLDREEGCKRTKPIPSEYAVYVRSPDFKKLSSSAGQNVQRGSLRAILIAGLLVTSLLTC